MIFPAAGKRRVIESNLWRPAFDFRHEINPPTTKAMPIAAIQPYFSNPLAEAISKVVDAGKSLPRDSNNPSILGKQAEQEKEYQTNRNDDEKAGIRQGSCQFAADRFLLFHTLDDASQHFFEVSGSFTRLHQTNYALIENLKLFSHGF